MKLPWNKAKPVPRDESVSGGTEARMPAAIVWMLPRTPATAEPGRARGRHYIVEAGAGIRRLRYEAPKGCRVTKESALAFTFHSPSSADLAADILKGDRGYPELRLINAHGTIYRFKRGNLKDFFDLRRPNTPQRLHLPLSSFIYDVDVKENVPEPPDFFSVPLHKVLFDFLPHPERDIDVCVADVAVEPHVGKEYPDAFDLLNVENLQQTPYLPKVVTYEPQIILSLQLNALGLRLVDAGSVLHWALSEHDQMLYEGRLPIVATKQTLRFELPRFGGYTLDLEIRTQGETVATGRTTLVRAAPTGDFTPTKFGISDSDQFDKIAALGGTYERTILNMSSLIKSHGRYRFKANGRTLPLAPPPRGRRRIIALKGMPKFLSRKPDLPDHHRYAAVDWAEYRRMIEWLAGEIELSGAWGVEVWNEASVRHEWNDELDQLVELHRVSAEAIRAVAPGLVVLSGSTNTWDPDFLRAFMAHGAWSHCDALAVHGYTYSPHQAAVQFDEIDAICRECEALKGQPFPCYVTEIGFRTPAFSPLAQAEQLVRYSIEAASRPSIGAILWFRYMNPRGEIGANYDQNASGGYAMLGHAGRYARPGLAAYRFLLETLAGTTPLLRRRYYDDRCAYVFRGPADERVVLVSYDPAQVHPVPPDAARDLTVFDLCGNRLTAPAGKLCYMVGARADQRAIEAWLNNPDDGAPNPIG